MNGRDSRWETGRLHQLRLAMQSACAAGGAKQESRKALRAAVTVFFCLAGAIHALGANQSLEFDGDDLVIIPNSASLNPARITIECQVNLGPLASDVFQMLICKGNDRAAGAYWMGQRPIDMDGARWLVFAVDYDGYAKGMATMATDRWYHLAGTYDGAALRVYLDGELVAVDPAGPISVGNSKPLYLSYSDISGFPFYVTGQMDEVRVWDYARSAEDIQASMWTTLTGAEPGLIGYWNFEEALDCQTVYDLSPNGNHGQLGTTPGVDSHDPVRTYGQVAPVANADGPYTVWVGEPLILDGSGSTDLNQDIVSYMWDLNDDGSFETDADDEPFLSVPYADLALLGLAVGGPYDIHLQVTDSTGLSDTAESFLRIVPEPASLALLGMGGLGALLRRRRCR